MKSLWYFILALFISVSFFSKADAQTEIDAPDYNFEPEGICEFQYGIVRVPEYYDSDFDRGNKWNDWFKAKSVFNHLDVSLSLGSMGVGLSFSTPVTKWVDIRAGVDWMPPFKLPMNFNLNTYANGTATGNFNHVAQLLYDNTGIEIDETVKMYGKATMWNVKLIVDVYPIPNNHHWRVSAGFFAGAPQIGKAYNAYEEKPTLVALNIYNRAYEYFTNLESYFDVPLGGGAYMDPDLAERIQNKFLQYGRMGIRIGTFKNGTPYIMEPSPDGTVTAKAIVNKFKPYLGAGYSTSLDKGKKWHFGFDAGVLFWGGKPDVLNYDYHNNREINLTKDMRYIRGKVGEYINAIKAFPVYPVVEFRFSYSIL